MRGLILGVIDFFYPPFKSIMPRQTFRYAACGGFNTLLDIAIFFVSYNFLFQKENVHLPIITLKPHIAAFLVSFMVTFPLGFYFSRYVVFTESTIIGIGLYRVKLFFPQIVYRAFSFIPYCI
jgi:hypothetical protein